MKFLLHAVLLAAGLIISAPVHGQGPILSVELDPGKIICKQFLGFGAEWDSNAYDASGITHGDFAIISNRVEWMRLPIARIMMQARWCYQGNGRYDWNAPQMKALYRHLDVCQKLGTAVVLTDWGVEPGWLKTPDVAKVEDPKYAEIISTYMDHLLNHKKYTCIKFFIFGNEPNLEIKDWNRWKKGLENVSLAFKKKGLMVGLMGSDQSGGDVWHRNAVDQLQNILNAYDIHRYASEESVRSGQLFDYYKTNWEYAWAKDPKAKDKPLIVGEAGAWAPGAGARNNPLHLDPRYGVFMADYAVQAANAGSWAVIAWMLDDNSHQGFSWGMWKSKSEGMATKPWFYTWSLLSRCFRPGTSILQVKPPSDDVRVLAAVIKDEKFPEKQSWTFCIVNRAEAQRTIRMHVKEGPRLNLKRFNYSAISAKTDKDGFPLPIDNLSCDLSAGTEIVCEKESVTILESSQ